MVLSEEVNVYGFNNVKEADLRTKSKSANFRGFNFPMGETQGSSYFQLISGKKLYTKNLTQLMRTNPGERFMLPNFGLNLKRFLFEPVTTFLIQDIRAYITNTINKYAPYLNVDQIEISSKSKSQAGFVADLIIKVKCSVREEKDIVIEVKLEV